MDAVGCVWVERDRVELFRMEEVLRMTGWQAVAVGLMASALGAGAQAVKPVTIDVDLSQSVGTYTPIYRWFGYDEADYTKTPQGEALLRELAAMGGPPVYVRAHHLLTSGDGVAELKWSSTDVYHEDADGKVRYDFRILDEIFDAWKAAGVKPMVELGFMPKDLAAKGPEGQPYEKHYPVDVLGGASNNVPKDYAKWGALVQAVVAHLVERYGRDEVLTWYFEVWNEPNIEYWHGTQEEYFRLYDYAAAGVKAALPGARVGGPATTGPEANPNAKGANADKPYTFFKAFLEHVRDGKSAATGGKIPLDFLTFHAKGRPTIAGGHVTMGISHEMGDVDRGFGLIASFPEFRKLPVILSEADPEGCAACSSKVNPANAYRNGTLYPAYTAAAYARMFALADRYGVNLIGMLTWSFEFEGKDTFEGFRSLATNGIDKPVLNFFRMAAKMDGERVKVESTGAVGLEEIQTKGVRGAPDVDALATKDGRGASVMVWNYQDTVSEDPAVSTAVVLRGMPSSVKTVRVVEYRVDDKTSNAYTAWQAMGSPAHPDAEQTAKLQAVGQLHALGAEREVAVKDGAARMEETLPGESVSLFAVSW